jgi:hypothetical protein
MDWQKIIIAVLTAITTVLALTGAINTEESGTLVSTGTAAVTGLGGFVVAIIHIIQAHRKGKETDEA